MFLGPHNQREVIDAILSDDGFRSDEIGFRMTDWRLATGLIPTASSTPKMVLVSTYRDTLQWVASGQQSILADFHMPRNLALALYDKSKTIVHPELKLSVNITTLGTDLPTIEADIYQHDGAGGVVGPWTVVSAAPVASLTQGLVLDFTGIDEGSTPKKYIQPGRRTYVYITPGAHTTDLLVLNGVSIQVRRNLPYTDASLRSG